MMLSDDAWLMTDDERSASHSEKMRRENYLTDLKVILDTPSGYRVMTEILRSLGVEQIVPSSAAGIALRRKGDAFLNDVQEVSVNKAMSIIQDIRTEFFNERGNDDND